MHFLLSSIFLRYSIRISNLEYKKMKDQKSHSLFIDLIIIIAVSTVALSLFFVFIEILFPGFAKNRNISVLIRVLVVGFFGQFGLAGMGISIVALIRKEPFTSHGLQIHNILPSIFISLLFCVPELIYYLTTQTVYSWFPFIAVNTTYEVLHAPFPVNILSYLLTALFWGFFEGFNYVVIADKINVLLPSKYRFWDWGAFIMAIMCLIIHGIVGVTPDALIEAICTMILIYGMLVTRKVTGNAWGCVAVFFLYWNTLNRYYPVIF